MITGIIIAADGTRPPRGINLNGLSSMQAAIHGYIEPIELEHPLFVMIVNEEGLLEGLAPNARATAIAAVHGGLDQTIGYVTGDVLLVGPTNMHGEFTDVPKEIYDLLLTHRLFDIEVVMNRVGQVATIVHGFTDWVAAYEAAVQFKAEYGVEFKVRAS